MKAFALAAADQPARIMEIPKPAAGDAGAVIAVKAASVNGFDVYQATGGLVGMMPHDFPTIVGRDFAGVVESVGAGITAFAAGDAVFGFIPSTPPLKAGSYAEYVAAGAPVVLSVKPADLTFEQAAALPLAGAAALDLLDATGAGKGDVVLIVGATGGVGSLAVQLAAQRGITVIATALPDQAEYVMSLGASETIDYSAGSVADAVRGRFPDGVAALIDVVNQKDALSDLAGVVRVGGQVATLMMAADAEKLAARHVTGTNVFATPTAEKLGLLAELAASGALRVEIQATYPIDHVEEALAAFRGGTRGKIVLTF